MKQKISVVGCGSLGSLLIPKLAKICAELKIIDRDFVGGNNLRIFYKKKDLGKTKAIVIKSHIEKTNKSVEIKAIVDDLNSKNICSYLNGSCLLIDCTDNMHTRYLLNDFSVKNRIPFIYGGAISFEGMSAMFPPNGKPCFRCLFPKTLKPGSLETCETRGVSPDAVEKTACYQFNQAVKVLESKKPDFGKLFYFKCDNKKSGIAKIRQNGKCPACAKHIYSFLAGKNEHDCIELCGRGQWQIIPARSCILNLNRIKSEFGSKYKTKLISGVLVHIEIQKNKISIFKNGRALISAGTKAEAKSLYSRILGD